MPDTWPSDCCRLAPQSAGGTQGNSQNRPDLWPMRPRHTRHLPPQTALLPAFLCRPQGPRPGGKKARGTSQWPIGSLCLGLCSGCNCLTADLRSLEPVPFSLCRHHIMSPTCNQTHFRGRSTGVRHMGTARVPDCHTITPCWATSHLVQTGPIVCAVCLPSTDTCPRLAPPRTEVTTAGPSVCSQDSRWPALPSEGAAAQEVQGHTGRAQL